MKLKLVWVFALCSTFAFAQDLELLLIAGKKDANTLLDKYTQPLTKGMLYGLNNGWYTTAKTHRPFGFDLTISASAAFVPKKEQFFDFVATDYQNDIRVTNGETSLSTIISDQEKDTNLTVQLPNTPFSASFDMPGSITSDLPYKAAPMAAVQFGLGLPFGTDIKLRFVPKINTDSASGNIFGLALQHDILQHFNLENNNHFNMSVLAGFTNLKASYNFDDGQVSENLWIDNGSAAFSLKTWTAQLLTSLDYKLISLYAGAGYNYGKSTMDVKGTYRVTYKNAFVEQTEELIDPVAISNTASGMRASVGLRLNLFLFKVFTDYTFQEYNTLTAGITFSFDKKDKKQQEIEQTNEMENL